MEINGQMDLGAGRFGCGKFCKSANNERSATMRPGLGLGLGQILLGRQECQVVN